ncbi:peptidoglycan-binding protein [Streptomyces filamentosus]|uniref:Membrane protein n=1 Tax=Streptomyces filamentosus TaxID=67294 RepID=A0A919BNU0_STRFL|nr:peptidoglycan-binding protein [Streptomyces filamentosus]KAA6217832.1 peptidoglycan-binding protein [Streptomyces filamentosus]GHF99758.1 membrane protein [Streptomyces filamentosus]
MSVPVFEEIEPAPDCGCQGCARQRRDLALGLPVRAGGHPAAHGARRALVLVTAAGAVLGGGGATGVATALTPRAPVTPADAAGAAEAALASDTPQGGRAPLHGPPGAPAEGAPLPGAVPTTSQISVESLRRTTRTEIINRAKTWVSAQVPYSMEKYWSDGYRQDCSGYISMAWNLRSNEWTGSLDRFAVRIDRAELQPGDILLFHNPASPTRGSHVTIFGGWTDYTHTSYIAYEQTKPRTRKQATPMAYWENSGRYLAYRYKGLVSGSTGAGATPTEAAYPGGTKFGPGANNAYVTRLGRMLVERGARSYYAQGPGPKWGEADRRATRAFQLAQGWKGTEADGLPGPHTWRLLVSGGGRDIGGSSGSSGPSTDATGFPGRGSFRPGQSNAYVEKLGKQLVKRGFGKHYLSGPGPRWTEADRRNVEAFQRAQGWRGAAADGYPGPETWRRLFR